MRCVARIGVILALLCAGLVIPGAAAQACTCAASTPDKNLKAADVVFLGDVVDRDPPEGSSEAATASEATYTFAVSKVFKGTVNASQPVVSQGLVGFCGQTFKNGETVLVFAEDESGSAQSKRYVTRLCSGTEVVDAAPASFGDGEIPEGYVEPSAVAESGGGSGLLWLLVAGGLVLAAIGGGVALFSRRGSGGSDASSPST